MIFRFVMGLAVELLAETVRWLAERPIRIVIVALLAVSVWLYGARGIARDLAEDRQAQAIAWHGKFRDQKAEMLKLVDIITAARIEAQRLDRVNAARVRAEWNAHLEKVSHDYEAELGAVRAAVADRLRDTNGRPRADCAIGGRPDAHLSAVPVLSDWPLRAGEAAIVDASDIDACTVNTLRLEHLVDAWGRAASITVNRP